MSCFTAPQQASSVTQWRHGRAAGKLVTRLIAAEQPVELLFFRAIFSELLRREIGISGEAVGDDHKISLEAFQIAMERLFFALNNYDGFDARSYDSNEDPELAVGAVEGT